MSRVQNRNINDVCKNYPDSEKYIRTTHNICRFSASMQLTVTSKHPVRDGLCNVLVHLMFIPDDDLNINDNSESLPFANAAFLTF